MYKINVYDDRIKKVIKLGEHQLWKNPYHIITKVMMAYYANW